MAKKSLICGLAIILLLFCCGVCFAAENKGNSINLGNEIMQSIDKTQDSFQNVVSGNVVHDTTNAVKDGGNTITNGFKDIGNEVTGTINNNNNDYDSNYNNDNNNNNNNNDNNRAAGMTGNYNATRTTDTINAGLNNGINTMSATTWMWIILIVAAVVILAAIWYYATQSNS